MQKGASAIPVRLSRVCLSPAATATARIGPKRVAIPIILAIEDGPSREHYGSVGEGSSPSSSGRGRRGVLIVSHDRSRMTIDPCIPTMPGRSTSGVHRPGRHCLQQARSSVRCSASRMKGEPHPTMNRFL